MKKAAAVRRTTKTSGARYRLANDRPSRSDAEEAVRTLIRWSGDNPKRPRPLGTPARVVRAYEEWFSGYAESPREYLSRTFDECCRLWRDCRTARNILRATLRTSPCSNYRSSPHRLSSTQSNSWNFETRSTCRCLCEALSNSREDDR